MSTLYEELDLKKANNPVKNTAGNKIKSSQNINYEWLRNILKDPDP